MGPDFVASGGERERKKFDNILWTSSKIRRPCGDIYVQFSFERAKKQCVQRRARFSTVFLPTFSNTLVVPWVCTDNDAPSSPSCFIRLLVRQLQHAANSLLAWVSRWRFMRACMRVEKFKIECFYPPRL